MLRRHICGRSLIKMNWWNGWKIENSFLNIFFILAVKKFCCIYYIIKVTFKLKPQRGVIIITTDVNPWYKWKLKTILALFLPESCKNRDKIG